MMRKDHSMVGGIQNMKRLPILLGDVFTLILMAGDALGFL